MKSLAVFSLLISVCLSSSVAADDKDRAVRQQQLDAACEAARQEKLGSAREREIEKCVTEDKKDRGYCERTLSNYGERAGNRPPLFYDLPECEKATDYRSSYRRPG